jgi:hypothetical protein
LGQQFYQGWVTFTKSTLKVAGRSALLGVQPAPPVWVWMITDIGVEGIVHRGLEKLHPAGVTM